MPLTLVPVASTCADEEPALASPLMGLWAQDPSEKMSPPNPSRGSCQPSMPGLSSSSPTTTASKPAAGRGQSSAG